MNLINICCLILFFTGLSGSGKTTLARALMQKLHEVDDRIITLLDGDDLRKNLSGDLGFSKEDRSRQVQRVGYIASEITKHRGIVLCSLIAPYENDRQINKQRISMQGTYVEIYVATPLSECEQRDPKGLYQKAREGVIPNFTGISDPYEEPKQADIVIDTAQKTIQECVNEIIQYLYANAIIK